MSWAIWLTQKEMRLMRPKLCCMKTRGRCFSWGKLHIQPIVYKLQQQMVLPMMVPICLVVTWFYQVINSSEFIRKLLKNYLIFQVSGLVKNIWISTRFSTPKTIKNHHETMKKQGLNVNLRIYVIFHGFSMNFGTWWVSLGHPWAPFFCKNAPVVGE